MSSPSWIAAIQGITTVLNSVGAALQRRSTLSFVGAEVTDDGVKTVVTIAGGSGAGIQGRLLRQPQILTAGTSINHPTGTRILKIRGVGASGAAGGTNAAAFSAGGASASGTYCEKTFLNPALTSTYVVGAAGAGVSAATGGAGTSSTFTNNGTTVTAPAGAPGQCLNGAATLAFATGGASGGAATNADVSVPGQTGGFPLRYANGDTFSSQGGGSNPLGNGAGGALLEHTQTVAGSVQGTGFGAGARGAMNGVSTSATAGANGLPGVWIVEEYS